MFLQLMALVEDVAAWAVVGLLTVLVVGGALLGRLGAEAARAARLALHHR